MFLLLNTISLLPSVDAVFGYNGIAGSRGFGWGGLSPFLNLLSHPINAKHEWIAWCFVAGQLTALTMGIFKIMPRLAAIGVYFFTVNLFLKASLFITGGEVLINILLFYMIFIKEDDTTSFFQNLINNTVYYILLIQICVLYFFSTYFKVLDPNWMSGMALTYISDIAFYTSDWFHGLVHLNESLAKVATYSVLLYQGLFFIAVWFKKIKIPFLIYGVIMHLGISFGMGIFSFGIIMIITYILFLEEKHIANIKQFLSFKRRKNNG